MPHTVGMPQADEDGFAQRLAKARALRGMSQHELGRRIGRREKDIARWEKGENRPRDPETYAALADALAVSTDFLLGRTSDPRDVAGVHAPAPTELTAAPSSSSGGASRRRRPRGKRAGR